MKTELEITGIDGVLNMLQQLPAEVVSKRGGPVKNALRKGARVIQREWLLNLHRVTLGDINEGTSESTGLLAENVIVSRGKAPIGGKGERALVRVRRKIYPGRSGEPVSTLKSAQLLEYGSSEQPAEPVIRPAFNAKAREAIDVTTTSLASDIERVAARLARAKG